MAWPDKLKLNKQLVKVITEAGYLNPKDVQQKTLARIIGGQDLIVIGPEGSGKTSTYILAVLNSLKHTPDGVPKTLILVPDKDSVMEVVGRFELLNKNTLVSIVGLYPAPGAESQMNALADGADIVVAAPERARAIYLKLGLNLNKISLFIIDDAELIVKQGLQLPVIELANSITRCQHLVFSTVIHDKLNKMIAPFMKMPATIEVEEIAETVIETYQQILYQIPDFGAKLNLLTLFLQDEELFTKTVVFVNSRATSEKIYKTLQNREKNTVFMLNSPSIEFPDFKIIEEFAEAREARVLIINDETIKSVDLYNIPFIIQFELPDSIETFINRVTRTEPHAGEETMAITFATDLELALVKKIEQAIGQKMPLGALPDGLIIKKKWKSPDVETKKSAKNKNAAPVAGEAFHQKKPENAKTYNYGSGVKAKMNKKKKHG